MSNELPIGKLAGTDLARLVYPYLGTCRADILLHANVGEDAAAVDLGGELCVLSVDPITGTAQRIGWLAVHIAANDLAACGAEPVGLLLTILLPPHCPAQDLEQIMRDASRAAASLGMEILGGHTEVTPYLPQAVIVSSAVGKVSKGHLLSSGGSQPGDTLYITKQAALEGTAILAAEFRRSRLNQIPAATLDQAESFLQEISVVPEGLLARTQAVHAMHDLTEGGLIGGAWEMMSASSCGLRLDLSRVPLRTETKTICQALAVDPYRLISSGAMLISTPAGQLEALFAEKGISLTPIGEFLPERKFFLCLGDTQQEGEPEVHEELWRILKESPD